VVNLEANIRKNFAERVKALREEKKITQEQLGKALNLSRSAIGEIENARKGASLHVLAAMADYFGVTIDYLVGRTEFKKGRLLTSAEIESFLPKKLNNLKIAVDDKEQQLSEITKNEIIEVLKKNGYLV
jgi:transcriptional regulator with XRE-family HTH domain